MKNVVMFLLIIIAAVCAGVFSYLLAKDMDKGSNNIGEITPTNPPEQINDGGNKINLSFLKLTEKDTELESRIEKIEKALAEISAKIAPSSLQGFSAGVAHASENNIVIYLEAKKPSNITFPNSIKRGWLPEDSPLKLNNSGKNLVAMTPDPLPTEGASIVVELENGNRYSVLFLPTNTEHKQDGAVTIAELKESPKSPSIPETAPSPEEPTGVLDPPPVPTEVQPPPPAPTIEENGGMEPVTTAPLN